MTLGVKLTDEDKRLIYLLKEERDRLRVKKRALEAELLDVKKELSQPTSEKIADKLDVCHQTIRQHW